MQRLFRIILLCCLIIPAQLPASGSPETTLAVVNADFHLSLSKKIPETGIFGPGAAKVAIRPPKAFPPVVRHAAHYPDLVSDI